MFQSLQKFLPPKKKVAVKTESDAALENQTAAGSCGTLASHKCAFSTADVPCEVSSKPVLDAQILSCFTAEVNFEWFGNGTIVSYKRAQGSCLAADIGNIFQDQVIRRIL